MSLELVEIRLYLGVSLCIYLFRLLIYSCWAIHFRVWYIYCFICFLFHCLLIYIHDVIHWYMSLSCVLWNQEFILFTYIFYTCVYTSCFLCFRKNIGWFNWAIVYTCNWWIVVRIEFVVMSILFVNGFFFVNFELLVVFCHGLPKGDFVRF